jgi:hypothetical protein
MHTYSQVFFSGCAKTLEYNVRMRKNTALSFRISSRLKEELERVALTEGRSLSQICEAFLNGGFEVYKKDGPKYLRNFFSRQKREGSA